MFQSVGCHYSPECVEGVFSEVQRQEEGRGSITPRPSPCS
jgi:hypothetical protein